MAQPGYSQRIENQEWDAERERLLDLLVEANGPFIPRPLGERIETALREYGRLGKEES